MTRQRTDPQIERDAADGLRALAATLLAISDDGEITSADPVRGCLADAVGSLRLPIRIRSASNVGKAVTMSLGTDDAESLRIDATEDMLSLRAEAYDLSFHLEHIPDLASDVLTWAERVETRFHMAPGEDDPQKAEKQAHLLGGPFVDAVRSCFADVLEGLGDDARQQAAKRAAAACRRAMDVCAVMADELRPNRIEELSVNPETRSVTAIVQAPGDPGRIAAVQLPLSEALRASLPGTPVHVAYVEADLWKPTGDTTATGQLRIDVLTRVAHDPDKVPEDPMERAALIRAYGSDGAMMANAIDAPFRSVPVQ